MIREWRKHLDTLEYAEDFGSASESASGSGRCGDGKQHTKVDRNAAESERIRSKE